MTFLTFNRKANERQRGAKSTVSMLVFNLQVTFNELQTIKQNLTGTLRVETTNLSQVGKVEKPLLFPEIIEQLSEWLPQQQNPAQISVW